MSTKPEVAEVAESFMEEIRSIANKDDGLQYTIPEPYFRADNGELYKRIQVKVGKEKVTKEVFICRHFPIITRKFSHVEHASAYVEIAWQENGRVFKEIVPQISISTRSECLKLSNRGLGVNENNVKDIIKFLDLYLRSDTTPTEQAVDRLGHVRGGGFINPLEEEQDVTIMPPDAGEKQLLEAFKTKGTSAEWIEHVFNPIKEFPLVLFYTGAPFASVMLKDLGLKPVIVDLAGITSRGKSTAQLIAASVMGKPEDLVGEFNITRVAVERKAAFLNSFALCLDDSQKCSPRILQDLIYQWSGGKTKGRGSIQGSQAEHEHNNILLTTGENSIGEFAKDAAGAHARVIPLTGLPFGDKTDYRFFNERYKAINSYYGQIGLDFIRKWRTHKEEYRPLFEQYVDQFQEIAATMDNPVVSRVARHYAAVVFALHLVMEFFGVEIDLDSLTDLYRKILKESTAADKPLEILNEILEELDGNRTQVWYEQDSFEPPICKALYNGGRLYILASYLREKLGPNRKTIRSEWMRRGITETDIDPKTGKMTDDVNKSHKGQKKRSVCIAPETLKELGFSFEKVRAY